MEQNSSMCSLSGHNITKHVHDCGQLKDFQSEHVRFVNSKSKQGSGSTFEDFYYDISIKNSLVPKDMPSN